MSKPIALITGASRGIGRSIAFRLARDGHRIVLNDHHRQADVLENVHTELIQGGADARIALADVSVEKDVKDMIEGTQKFGGLDVMVANAGIAFAKPLLECSLEDYHKIFSVNSMGAFLCYRYAAEAMVKQGRGGRIIGAASLAGKEAWPLLSLYSSTKFALRGLTQAAARELAAHGITVNAYAPGPVDTSMSEHWYDSAILRLTPPTGRYATPDEVAHLVSFLASKEASQISGQTLGINGAMHLD
ncbi:NAD(P)-binding protein [Crepidotus variabilis]|uniref:3-oxoacyl-[acyl-carrier-protein] reductase n=1 Tax=Crepidotus variabilis TaxID=179855 RepID=A0A9P6E7Y7_9AGAR|nr:NAD(P)-binding protein [Crepidotus variabilis]